MIDLGSIQRLTGPGRDGTRGVAAATAAPLARRRRQPWSFWIGAAAGYALAALAWYVFFVDPPTALDWSAAPLVHSDQGQVVTVIDTP